jgi:hypothetical protein
MAKSTGRYTQRTIGSEPTRRESPKEVDPKTESMRETLRGNPFGKKYHGKEYGE